MPLYKNLSQILAEKIKSKGPISVAEYMSQSLGHPDFGYYTNNNPFGLEGDFTTAPEISQMFGELIGLWCANTWVSLGKPGVLTFHKSEDMIYILNLDRMSLF